MRNRLWIPLLLLLGLTLTAIMGFGIRLALDEQSVIRKRYAYLFYDELESVRAKVDSWRAAFEGDAAKYAEALRSGSKAPSEILRADARIADAQLTEAPPLSIGWHAVFEQRGVRFLYVTPGPRHAVIELAPDALIGELKRCLPDGNASTSALLSGLLIDPVGQVIAEWGPPRSPDALDVAGASLPPPFQRFRLQGAVPPGFWSKSFYSQALFTVMPSLLLMILLLSVGVAVLLRRHEQEVRETSDRMSFLNRVSHELKTPLTNIRLYAELLEARLEGEDRRTLEYLQVILRESNRLSRFITSVLSFAKSERHELHITRRPGLPMNTIRDVVEEFRPVLDGEGVQVKLATSSDTRCSFDADAVTHIVGNLLANVQHYAADGGSVAVRARMIGNALCVRISDRGPGIPPVLAERIFEPFFRGTTPPRGSHASTGLGLAIARELARLHDGELRTVPSRCGGIFCLRLRTEPLSTAEHPEDSHAHTHL